MMNESRNELLCELLLTEDKKKYKDLLMKAYPQVSEESAEAFAEEATKVYHQYDDHKSDYRST